MMKFTKEDGGDYFSDEMVTFGEQELPKVVLTKCPTKNWNIWLAVQEDIPRFVHVGSRSTLGNAKEIARKMFDDN